MEISEEEDLMDIKEEDLFYPNVIVEEEHGGIQRAHSTT